MGVASWEYLNALAKYEGSETAHEDVVACLKRHGHSAKMSDAWCTETVMAALYDCGAISLVGGYSQISGDLKKKAEKKGIYHKGMAGVLPGDIIIFGENSKPNHTEVNVGNLVDISGNYNKGCGRRTYRGRHTMGYVRPKWAVKEMDNLQVVIGAADSILGVYGSGNTRKTQLAPFGSKNAQMIQDEVDRIWDDMDKILFDLAVYVIAGHAAKGSYRAKRLGSFAERVQEKIDDIYALRGKSVEEAAQLVLDDKFGKNAVRRLLLKFCGYDPDAVQAAVNKALEAPKNTNPEGLRASVVSLFRDADRSTKDVDGLQGNMIIIKDHVNRKILGIDSMRSGALDRVKAELKGYDVEWYISHPHSDHMGSNINNLVKAGIIKRLYLPQRTTIHKDYQARFDALVKQCSKSGVPVTYLKQGDIFTFGGIRGKVIYQQINTSTDSVNMRSLCTLFTVAGTNILYCGDHHCGKKESTLDASKIGHVHIYISAHHQLYTGDTDAFIKEISPEWIIGAGWKAWPLGTICQDAKVKAAQKAYQKYGNLLPGDVVGRTELSIEDGVITAMGQKNMVGKTVKYVLNGKTYQKTVHVCEKAKFVQVLSMIPENARFA